MDAKTQQISLIILGLLGMISLIYNKENLALLIVGIIGGYIGNKTITEKQAETINKALINDIYETE